MTGVVQVREREIEKLREKGERVWASVSDQTGHAEDVENKGPFFVPIPVTGGLRFLYT